MTAVSQHITMSIDRTLSKKGLLMVINFKKDLSEKVFVITGGGGVLCSVLASAAGECGARIALIDSGSGSTAPVADRICQAGGDARSYVANVLDKQALEAACEQILDDYGHVDVLLNGAGGNKPTGNTDDEFLSSDDLGSCRTFFDLPREGFDDVLTLNLQGTVLPSQVFGRAMVGRKGCSIINMSSMNAFTPLTKIPAYSSAKAAVTNFTSWLATYLAPVSIRVNAIAPGFFSTKQNASLLWNEDGSPTARTHKILSSTPMGRFGVPEELVGTFLYLADPNASGFVSGVCIPVDGAFSSYSGV